MPNISVNIIYEIKLFIFINSTKFLKCVIINPTFGDIFLAMIEFYDHFIMSSF